MDEQVEVEEVPKTKGVNVKSTKSAMKVPLFTDISNLLKKKKVFGYIYPVDTFEINLLFYLS